MKRSMLVLLLVACTILEAQNVEKILINSNKSGLKKNVELTGVLNLDSKIAFDQTINLNSNVFVITDQNKKSPLIAAGLSLLIPGAGEFYSERYIKSAAFIAVEAAAIIIGFVYDKKGDDQTAYFQSYANGENGWSVYRYANWTLTNIKKLNPALNPDDYKGKVIRSDGSVDWDWLNKLETAVSFDPNNPKVAGSYYSHRLPPRGSQQYYELIGKYAQFNVGWKQFGDDPTRSYDFNNDPLVPQFLEYSKIFFKADDYYNYASKAVVVVVVNHLISALDAAWSAHNYNKDLEVHASLEKFQNGITLYYYPQLNLQYRF